MDDIDLEVDLLCVHLLLEEVEGVDVGCFNHFCLLFSRKFKCKVRRVFFEVNLNSLKLIYLEHLRIVLERFFNIYYNSKL